jgi:hypothetical protein
MEIASLRTSSRSFGKTRDGLWLGLLEGLLLDFLGRGRFDNLGLFNAGMLLDFRLGLWKVEMRREPDDVGDVLGREFDTRLAQGNQESFEPASHERPSSLSNDARTSPRSVPSGRFP